MRNANDEMRESLGVFSKFSLTFIDAYGSPFISFIYFLSMGLSLFFSEFVSTIGYIELFLMSVVILGIKQLIRHQQIQADIQAEENRLFMDYIGSMERNLFVLQSNVYHFSEWNNCRFSEEDWNKLSAIVETIVGNKVALLEKLNKKAYEGKTTKSNRRTSGTGK